MAIGKNEKMDISHSSLTTQEHMVIPQAVKADVTSAIIPVNVIKLIHEILQTLPIKYQ